MNADEASELRKRLQETTTERDQLKRLLSRYVCEGCDSEREGCVAVWTQQKKCCPDCTHDRERTVHSAR